jgi:hypothetical protein
MQQREALPHCGMYIASHKMQATFQRFACIFAWLGSSVIQCPTAGRYRPNPRRNMLMAKKWQKKDRLRRQAV